MGRAPRPAGTPRAPRPHIPSDPPPPRPHSRQSPPRPAPRPQDDPDALGGDRREGHLVGSAPFGTSRIAPLGGNLHPAAVPPPLQVVTCGRANRPAGPRVP